MYLQLYNVFSMEGNKYHLSMKELFVYSLLKRRMDFAYSTITTIDVLIQLFDKQGINIHNKQSEKRKRIKNQLQSLQDKGVIKIEGDYSKNNELLEISFVDVTDNGKGFAQIEFSTFDNINDISDLYIYYVVSRFNNEKNEYKVPFNCDDKRWSRTLDVKSITTVRSYIEQAIEKGLIYKNSGDYNTERARKGQNGQDISQYKVVPFSEEEKSNMQRKKERVEDDSNRIPRFDLGDNEFPFDTGNWLNNNNLDVNDYVIYFDHKAKSDPISIDFIAYCDNIKRNRIMKGNEKFKHIEEKLKKQAREEIEQREQEKQAKIAEIQRQAKIDKIKDGQIIVIRNSEDVYLDRINDVEVEDKLYRVQKMESPFDGDSDFLSDHSIFDLITKQNQNYDFYYHYSDTVKSQLLDKFKKVYSTYDEFDVYKIGLEMDEFRNELLGTYNANKHYDDVWEEDIISMDDNRNISLQQRKREHEEQNKPTNNGGIKLDLQ